MKGAKLLFVRLSPNRADFSIFFVFEVLSSLVFLSINGKEIYQARAEMSEMDTKRGFTTGQVAELCHVTIPTVIKWIDTGRLNGFKIPGSKSRRVTREHLVEFMAANGIPTDRLQTKKKLLIVDDDKHILELLKTVFEKSGDYEIRAVGRGFDAGLAKEYQPDVILLDIMLPDIDGRQVCSYIREDPELSSVKIMAVSGYVSKGDIAELKGKGFDDYLEKPFDNDVLVEKVQSLAFS